MHILINIAGFYFELKITSSELCVNFLLGSKTIIAYDKEFIASFRCTECSQEVEDDGQLLRLCEHHKEQFLEHWYNRWLNK